MKDSDGFWENVLNGRGKPDKLAFTLAANRSRITSIAHFRGSQTTASKSQPYESTDRQLILSPFFAELGVAYI